MGMEKRYFKILLEYGHLGNRNSVEVERYITAKNCVEALLLGNRMPRVKRKRKKTGAVRVIEIDYQEYLKGRQLELEHTYWQNSKKRKCI
jgi:hypothetical protein